MAAHKIGDEFIIKWELRCGTYDTIEETKARAVESFQNVIPSWCLYAEETAGIMWDEIKHNEVNKPPLPPPECKRLKPTPNPPKPGNRPLDFIQSMQVLKIEKGDVIVVRHPGKLPDDQVKRLKQQLEALWVGCAPENKIAVLDEGMDIVVLRKEGKE